MTNVAQHVLNHVAVLDEPGEQKVARSAENAAPILWHILPRMTASNAIDALTMFGFFGFPAYGIYWVSYQLRHRARHRLWVGVVAFLMWCAATVFWFLRPMSWCFGGGCAGRVSPFLQYALLYALSSAMLMLAMHVFRVPNSSEPEE